MTKIFLKTRDGADATGEYASGKVTIKKGSILTIDPCGRAPSPNIKPNYATACEHFEAGYIIRRPDGRHEVVNDIAGLSPSAASVIVTGHAGSGWKKWKLKDGKLLDTLRQSSSSPSSSQVGPPGLAKTPNTTVSLEKSPGKWDSGGSCAKSACEFINYLRDRTSFRVDLEEMSQWMSGAFNAAGGPGNPKGSKIEIEDLAKREIEAVVENFLSTLCRDQFIGYARFEWLFSDAAHSIENIVNVSSPATWFTFGRAQKILNIITKYCYAWRLCKKQRSPRFGDVSWVDKWKKVLHVPVDRFTMKHLADLGQYDSLVYDTRPNLVSWKRRMDEYRYLGIQDAIRKLAADRGLDPLCYEMKYIWTRQSDGADDE